MNQNYKRRSYDDMDPNSRFNQEDQKVKALKRVVTTVVILLIVSSIAVAALLIIGTFGQDDQPSDPAVDTVQLPEQQSPEQILDTRSSDDQPTAVEQPPVQRAEVTEAEEPEDEGTEEIDEPADSAQQETEEPEAVTFTDYTVAAGDTLNSIAQSFSVRPETIIGVNDIENINDLQTGRALRIPDRDGQIYTVQEGESLSVIAHRYGMGYVTLAEVNGLSSSLIRVGQQLFIPDHTISAEAYQKVMNTLFIAPAEGEIIVDYGDQVEDILTGELYSIDGVRIENRPGTPVAAAMAGTVTEAANQPSGLGRYVIIAHDGGYTSTYGHLDTYAVSAGDRVDQGQQIGVLGSTGRILEPLLYFSIKQDGRPVDPAEFF
jgi:murein DD-endopeptidase MepM/ murein hydrolase activator NlpD